MLMNAGKRMSGSSTARRAWIASVVIVALLAVSAGAWTMWQSQNKKKLLASISEDPRQIREAVRSGQISRDEARDAFMGAMEARMDQTMDAYFALPAGTEREKYLDNLINEFESRRREWRQQRESDGPTTRPEWANRDGERRGPPEAGGDRQQRWAARGDATAPERRAMRAEFRAAMMARMAERGIQPGRGGFGGGPGGWGGRGGGGARGGGGGAGR